MASAIPPPGSSPVYVSRLHRTLVKLSETPSSALREDTCKQIRAVIESNVDLRNPRERLFAFEVNAGRIQLASAPPNNIAPLAKKVLEATIRLIRAQQHPIRYPRSSGLSQEASHELTTALHKSDVAALRLFAKEKTHLIGKDQLPALCDWAFENRDFHLLANLVLNCQLPEKQLNRFVKTAFKSKKSLAALAHPLMLHDFHLLEPKQKKTLETDFFQKAVKWTLKENLGEGAFDSLLVADQMKQLPPETIEKLLVWADDTEDFRLASFLIKNDLVPAPLLNEILEGTFEMDSFGDIAEAVYPDRLQGVLTEANRRRIQEWIDQPFPKIQ